MAFGGFQSVASNFADQVSGLADQEAQSRYQLAGFGVRGLGGQRSAAEEARAIAAAGQAEADIARARGNSELIGGLINSVTDLGSAAVGKWRSNRQQNNARDGRLQSSPSAWPSPWDASTNWNWGSLGIGGWGS